MTSRAKTKILAYQHTGKIRQHRHTSWGSLLLLVGVSVLAVTLMLQPAAFAATSGGGSYGVYASVPSPKPTTAPTISSPVNGAVFHDANSVTVSGSCPDGTTVRVYKSEVLAGAVQCQAGHYSLPIDLFIGANTLVVRAYTAEEAVSPDSVAIGVTLQPTGSGLATIQSTAQLGQAGVPASQFYLTSLAAHQGGKPGEQLSWTLTATGGQAPYAVNIDWGDGNTKLISRGTSGNFDISHKYSKAPASGSYTIIVKGIDQQGSTAYLQFVGVISPSGGVLNTVSRGFSSSVWLRAVAGTLLALFVLVVVFWLGERRELIRLKHQGLITA